MNYSTYAGTRENAIQRNEWEWQETPPYDIINNNIHVWVYKKSGINYGFAITGHARAEVCEVASLEVFNTLSQLGLSGKDYLVAGAAYSDRSKKDKRYHRSNVG